MLYSAVMSMLIIVGTAMRQISPSTGAVSIIFCFSVCVICEYSFYSLYINILTQNHMPAQAKDFLTPEHGSDIIKSILL